MVTKFRGDDNYDSVGGAILQLKTKLILNQSYILSTASVDNNVPNVFIDFVPLSVNSKIHIELRWFGETNHDCMFNLHRDGVRVNGGVNNTAGHGIASLSSSYINVAVMDTNSTPDNCWLTTTDTTPNVVGQSIRYQFVHIPYVARWISTNRCAGYNQTDNYEHGSTQFIVTEYGA